MYTYLIVDDETLIRKGVIKKLAPLSHLVECCGEADSGAAAIGQSHPACPAVLAAAPGMSLVAGESRMRKHIAVIWRLVGSFICPPPRTARRRTRAC